MPGKVAISLFLWPQLAGVFIAKLFANIVPNPGVVNVACGLSFVYAVAWSVLLEVAIRGHVWDPNQKRFALLNSRWRRIPAMITVFFLLGYFSFAFAYPWMYTELFGTKHSKEFVVTGWSSGGSKSCFRPRVGHSPFADGPAAFCTSSDGYERMPPGTRLGIVGPETFLGINTDEIYILKSP